MTAAALETLLERLLTLTLSLESLVMQEDADPQRWVEILDQRGEVMEQISGLDETGIRLSEEQKRTYLEKVHEIDQRVLPIMIEKKAGVQSQLHNIQRSKAVHQHYGGYRGYNPYGAFFDKRN